MHLHPSIEDVLPALPEVEPADRTSDWFTAPSYYPLYAAVGQVLRPARVLEIGTRLGYSLIALAHGSRRLRRFWWVDNESYLTGSNTRCVANLQHYFEQFRPDVGPPSYRYATALTSLLDLPSDGVDLVHVDGDHTYAGAWRDLAQVWNLGRAILVDDYRMDGVGAAVRDWARHAHSEFHLVDTWQRGMAVFDRTGAGEVLGKLQAAGLPLITGEVV